MASLKSMVHPADREALALNNKLTPRDLEKIDQTLDVLDDKVGVSSRRALQLVSEQPGLVSGVLARQIGVDRMTSRAVLYELRDLGLVYGLEVGYSVSPRGRAYMRSTDPG
jgi:predicted transcriptional regulator